MRFPPFAERLLTGAKGGIAAYSVIFAATESRLNMMDIRLADYGRKGVLLVLATMLRVLGVVAQPGEATDTLAAYLQDANNPFELRDYGRDRPDAPRERDLTVRYDNPFELVKYGRIAPNEQASIAPETRKKRRRRARTTEGEQKRVEAPLFEWKDLNVEALTRFGALVVIALFVALLSARYRVDVQRLFRAFGNKNLMLQLYRDHASLLRMPYAALYLLFFLSSGALLYLVLDYYGAQQPARQWVGMLQCMGWIGGFYVSKHLLIKAIAAIFPFSGTMHEYHFTMGVFNQVLGVLLVPLVALVAFGPEEVRLLAIWGAYGVVALVFVLRQWRVLGILQPYLAFHKFHLIVYICTVEIAPVFIVIRLIMTEL